MRGFLVNRGSIQPDQLAPELSSALPDLHNSGGIRVLDNYLAAIDFAGLNPEDIVANVAGAYERFKSAFYFFIKTQHSIHGHLIMQN